MIKKMGDYQQSLPVDSFNLVKYDENFARIGLDGDEPIFSLFGSKYFAGESLAGIFEKANDGVILGPHTTLISNGKLQLTGKAAVASNPDSGWVWSQNQLYLLDKTVVDVRLELPGHSDDDNFMLEFYLTGERTLTNGPAAENEFLKVYLKTTAATYYIRVRKSVGNVESDVYAETTVTNLNGIFRFKFQETLNGHEHTHIYYHDGSGLIDESSDELTGSPFSLALNFNEGYVAYVLTTEETTNRTVSSPNIIVTYPDFNAKYDLLDEDVNKGDVEVWDQRNEESEDDWIQVFDEDHDFEGDCIVQSGLMRIWLDKAAEFGFKLYFWDTAPTPDAWVQVSDRISWRLFLDDIVLKFSFLKRIKIYGVNKTIISIREENTSTQDGDYYIDYSATIERGQRYITLTIDTVYPQQDLKFRCVKTAALRWGFVSDAETFGIGDDDLNLNANNTAMTDNFLVAFDNAASTAIKALMFVGINEKPNGNIKRFRAEDGGNLLIQYISPTDFNATEIYLGITPFSKIANLFAEAEDEDTDGTTSDPCTDASPAGAPICICLDDGEYLYWDFIVGADLPAGRYVALYRMKADVSTTNVSTYVYNFTDSNGGIDYRNEENAAVTQAVTDSWTYYQLVFDITDVDVADITDHIRIYVTNANSNNVCVDYFLIVPIGNGENWVQDLTHSALRNRNVYKRVFER